MSKLFQLSAQVSGVKTTADKSLEIRLHTNDLATFSKDQLAALMESYEKQYYVAFAEQELKVEDIDLSEPAYDKGEKTPAQRLRAVIYRLWELTDRKIDSEAYYRSYMERIIEQIKEKLDGS